MSEIQIKIVAKPILLAEMKLKAARIVLETAEHYLETVSRLQVEARKLADEAEKLIKGEYASIKQGQPGTALEGHALEALPGCVPSDTPEQAG